MSDLRVTCINKTDHSSLREGITHLGGEGWNLTRLEVVQSIRAGEHTFFTLENNQRAEVRIVETPNGPYLTTSRDAFSSDNLLKLRECS
jgi:hypothetical protein